MGLRRRLERLEGRRGMSPRLDVAALFELSDAALAELEETVEVEVAAGERSFWDLYAVISAKSHRARSRLLEAYRRHRSVPEEIMASEAGEAPLKESDVLSEKAYPPKNAYRIWRYYDGSPMPESLRRELYEKKGGGM